MHYDVAILGSGFAGSILARVLRRQGRRVVLIEKGRHPRFALGESTTPLANFVLERLAARYELPDLHHLSTWGRWRTHLPDLRRGLKRGFTFYRHQRGETYRNSEANEARLLVAASPNDVTADTHWLRADVDHHLVKRALAEGVDYFDETELSGVELGSKVVLIGTRRHEAVRLSADYVIDGSGPAGFVARGAGGARRPLQSSSLQSSPLQSSLLYAHFEGLGSFVDIARAGGAVLNEGPYADEQAAVHHLLDEGWMYVLPFDPSRGQSIRQRTVSAGIILSDADDEIRRDPEAAWRELLSSYPSLARQFEAARPVRPLAYIPSIQHRLDRAVGERWFALPHTFAFTDPLFSTGMAWSLLAVERLASLFEGRGGDAALYESRLIAEADRIEELITAAHQSFGDFDRFTALTQLYFITVSFAELRQRLSGEGPSGEGPSGEGPSGEGFLGVGDPVIDEAFRLVNGAGPRVRPDVFLAELSALLAPRNVAGLADPARRNLYPVDLDVLIDRAHLLGLDRQEIVAALPRLRGDEIL